MSLKYYLTKNNLAAQPNAYMARSQRGDKLSFEQLADLMVQRGSSLTKSDIIAAENLRFEIEQEMLRLGFTLAGRWMRMALRVKGNFNGPADNYDSSRHSVCIRFSTSKFTRKFQSDIQVQRVNAPRIKQPALYMLTDYASREVNRQVTIGRTAKIAGVNLQFDPEDPQQGIFFVEAGTEETLARVYGIMEHKPSWLLFEIPATLATGKYVYPEMRSRRHNSKLHKERLQDVLLTVS